MGTSIAFTVGCVMRRLSARSLSSSAPRLVLAGFAAAFVAGCSSDVTRFASDPFSMDPAPTSSIPSSAPNGGIDRAPVGVVTAEPLAPISSQPLPPAASVQQPAYQQPAPVYQAPRTAAAPVAQPVQQLPAKTAAAPAPAPGKNEKVNFVRGPQSAADAKAAEAKPVDPKAAAAKASPVAAAAPAKTESPKVDAKSAKVEAPKAEAAPAQQVALAKPEAAPAQSAAGQAAADDKPEFRWPARGRIIKGFKAGSNEGINISVPEGTPVKAAESGIVVYAGNEVKGYGNMVLIRHPNGCVSAYANNGEVLVKRGDQVKRGQAVAKSGQSGDVSAPQLHFELRKGQTPVDPTQYLAGL